MEDGEAERAPAELERALRCGAADPPRGDPGEGAGRVEPEVDLHRRHLPKRSGAVYPVPWSAVSRRIEIELTSARDDGSWTWRAAGAREPRGVVEGSLLPSGSSTGDVLRADVETSLDGTTVLAVLPPKGPSAEPDRIELVGAGDPEQWVTTVLAPGRPRRDDRDRGGRGDRRGRKDGRPPRQGRDDRSRGRDRPGARRRPRRPAPPGAWRAPRPPRGAGRATARPLLGEPAPSPRPPVDTRPKPKRLRPNRTHRKAALAELPAEQQPVAEQVLKGGIPAVRAAVAKQNEQARAEGKPEVKADQLVDLAEKLLPRLRAAEWRDRAEAAMADLEELDLRDLRSVIVAAEGAARDDESRALATSLREGLARRVDQEQSVVVAGDRVDPRRGPGGTGPAAQLATAEGRRTAPGRPRRPADRGDQRGARRRHRLRPLGHGARRALVLPGPPAGRAGRRSRPNPTRRCSPRSGPPRRRVPQIAARFGIDPATTPPPRRGGAPGGRRRPRGGRPRRVPPPGPTRPRGQGRAGGLRPADRRPRRPLEQAPPPEPAVEQRPCPRRAGRRGGRPRPRSRPTSRRRRRSPSPGPPRPSPPRPRSRTRAGPCRNRRPRCVEQVEHVERVMGHEVRRHRPGPRVPRSQHERAADGRGAGAVVVGVAHEHDLVAGQPERVEHRLELLGPGEGVGEQRQVGRPAQPGQLGPARARVLVRADRPAVERVHQLGHPGERLGRGLVVVVEVVLDRQARAARTRRRARGRRSPRPPAPPRPRRRRAARRRCRAGSRRGRTPGSACRCPIRAPR